MTIFCVGLTIVVTAFHVMIPEQVALIAYCTGLTEMTGKCALIAAPIKQTQTDFEPWPKNP